MKGEEMFVTIVDVVDWVEFWSLPLVGLLVGAFLLFYVSSLYDRIVRRLKPREESETTKFFVEVFIFSLIVTVIVATLYIFGDFFEHLST
jgi:predicted PurR-regulated permease PerM